jgi:HD-GYP domain-containing protein (c-di-GMP phosphodiesterase class II)/ribosomal protein S27AE
MRRSIAMNHVEHLLKNLFVMASIVEARDPYTGGHLWRVSQFSRMLAEEGGLPSTDVARIALGGFLHDLGKIAVPDAVLNKPDKLTYDEYEISKTHAEIGNSFLSDHPLAELARSAVLSHHEMPNGRGYPQGLSGDQISVDASIVGICDAFDAMTSTRPYRKGMPAENTLCIIQDNLGSQFHAVWGERFIKLGEAGKLNPIIGHSEPDVPLQHCPSCGPTVIVSRHHHAGVHVYCRQCGGEAEVQREGVRMSISLTGRRGTIKDLKPEIDNGLIDDLVRESYRHLAIS